LFGAKVVCALVRLFAVSSRVDVSTAGDDDAV
jgi:hypothetical protein